MANNIELASKFVPIVDKIYKEASKTAALDATTKPDFSGTPEVKYLQVSTTGLGDYNRETGYSKGDVTANWITAKLAEERGKEISVDRMDDEETLGLTFGNVVGEFMRTQVIPELDAYRFAKYATGAGTTASADLTVSTVLPAIDAASAAMDAAEVPIEGRVLYVSTALKPMLNQALTREWASDRIVNNTIAGYNDMQIIYVPVGRFYNTITLNDGSTAWGYTGTGALNFIMCLPSAVFQVVKFALPKIFSPDVNQDKDAWKFQFREYHDAFIYDNKTMGVYAHSAGA